jgi:hypothetical protein
MILSLICIGERKRVGLTFLLLTVAIILHGQVIVA